MTDGRRIAMISEHASPLATIGGEDAGGQNVYVAELSRYLARLGYQVDVFTRRDAPHLPEVVPFAEGVRVIHLAAGPPEPIKKDLLLPYIPQLAQELVKFCRREGLQYHLVHAHFWMSGLAALESKAALQAPVVQTFHALGAIKRLYQANADTSPPERHEVEMRIVRQSDAIIATCPNEVDELRRYYRANIRKISVVPCGVNLDLFQPIPRSLARRALGLDDVDHVVLCVSRMVPRKGVDNVIRAIGVMHRQKPRSLRLLVVGGDREDADPLDNLEIRRLARVAREEGVDPLVRFVGRRPQADLKTYYSAADVFVTTPWYEPFGMTPLEAMACGTPVVASAVGGHLFSIVDGATGLLVPPRDPEYLAAALGLLLKDDTLRSQMSRAARRRVEDIFSWENVASQVAHVYERVIAGATRAATGTRVAYRAPATGPSRALQRR